MLDIENYYLNNYRHQVKPPGHQVTATVQRHCHYAASHRMDSALDRALNLPHEVMVLLWLLAVLQ
ncbi:hypothetical protein HaLaN_05155 [Haematococcus lacustris]|uniref:Uncharacterized protein n=1 Tax=Haematococcus lacustris TaxID=44745 RepID=A0A699YSZ2_HAELA|nr:hypothetical protein HaLaN_05155 [Haematococcus lacustris]